ncbi:RYamide receptor-like isoform X2 [Planococcus citri]|uniref:RYamide receptor-like isoform X2 n=1 Tax=Planococcus citri TaxID=170843 RepID=UPI0031FA03F4
MEIILRNAYIANVALADLLISGIVIMASAVVLLAGLEDCLPVCHLQWFLGLLCGLVTILSLLAIAMENYARLCLSPECYARITTNRITTSIIFIWTVSVALVTLHFFYNLGPEYCNKKGFGNKPYQFVTAAFFFLIPLCVTGTLYAKIVLCVRAARAHASFKPPLAFNWDYSLMLTNMYSYVMFIIFWAPFAIFMTLPPIEPLGRKPFCWSVWFALSKSCFNNLLYCISNRHFCDAYVKLFHYCCCKTTVTFSRRPRTDGARPSGDVRVHIIPGYNVYPYTSPQRGSTGSGENMKKAASSGKRAFRSAGRHRSKDRDVYQL